MGPSQFCLFVCAFILCFDGFSCRRTERDVSRLLEKYKFNQYLLAHVPKPFRIVFPKQIKKRLVEPVSTREKQVSHNGMFEHMEEVTLQVVMEKKSHKIKLYRNDGLISAGIKVKNFQADRREIITKTVEHCFYQGVVKRDAWSAVAVSTCNGVRGVIQMNNETFIIQPLEGGQSGEDQPHMVYKATPSEEERCGNDHGKWLPFNELHKGEFTRKLKFLRAQRTMSPIEATSDRFLKLALVLDNSMYWNLNRSVQQMTEYALETANIIDMYYKEINIRIALTYIELWNIKNRMPVTPVLRETLENFMKYQQQFMRDVDRHTVHLLTRRRFEDNSVGMAIPDSVCTQRAAGVSQNPDYLEPQKGATVLAHMIGHNLGIKHDEDGGCQCEDEFGCIMSTEVLNSIHYESFVMRTVQMCLGDHLVMSILESTVVPWLVSTDILVFRATPVKHSRMFSMCSVKDWDVSLNLGIATCLSENPQPTFPQVCGNKQVERGEECDCGSPEDCAKTDPCCDPSTCLLKYWADCRTGECCHNCTYLSSEYMCRAQSSDCDVPEFCTGTTGQCPPNNYAKDGHSCNNDTGYCMGGICPTLDQQCQHIWGKDAEQADIQCFERFNPTGNFNGHCGKDEKTNSYAECLPDDVQCGLIHCSGGNKQPFFGPDKDCSKTTFSSNGKEFECKTVHGPSTLGLPNLGLVLDGTKCGQSKMCSKRKCVSLSNLPPMTCPGSKDGTPCSGNGICTKEDTCYCHTGWGSPDCSVKVNVTKVILTLDMLVTTNMPSTTTTQDPVHVIPLDVVYTTGTPVPSDLSSSAVVQASEKGLLNTKWMMIILASVIGGLGLLLLFSFVCYRRRSPAKFNKEKKKPYVHHSEEGEMENTSKLIKFGNLPSYKKDKKKKNKKGKKKGSKCEDDSDIELPPPPMIISDPNSAKPEKGILKGSFGKSHYINERRSSESNTVSGTSSGNCDQDSVGPYDEIDDDTEAGEIQDIFGTSCDEPERSLDALDNMIESSSFDFMLPPPFSNMGLLKRSPSPPSKFSGYDIPMTNLSQIQRPNLWKPNLGSPPKSRVLRMRNLDELLQNIDRNTIDLSPSPDDPPVQISPSTSEDVRSSSTDDRQYQTSSHDPQSPNSITSGSTCTALRPLLGSQWSKYILHRNNPDAGGNFDFDDIESPLSHINIPPPMNPINVRSIFNYGQKGVNRDNNDTPLGSQNGDGSSTNGTGNSRNGYEKSSGYGSEHDPERYSIEDVSRNQSRSGSTSPPNFSAVIRTGPNQIRLVPASKLQSQTGLGGYSYNPMDNDLQKLLEGVPKIDAGCYERSPLNSNVTSGTSTLETLKNSDFSSSGLNSDTNTLVNSDYETMERLRGDDFINAELTDTEQSTDKSTEHPATSTLEMLKQSLPEFSNGLLPNPKPLSDIDREIQGSGPCIDRSLEEISHLDNQKSRKGNRNSITSVGGRPMSLSVLKKQESMENPGEGDPLLNRYSAIDTLPVDICEC